MDKQSQRAYLELKRLICEGAFAPGQKLREAHLAEMLETSRTPARHALNRLESEGFVEYEARRGHKMKKFTLKDVQEIYAVRALLEPEAVKILAMSDFSSKLQYDLTEIVFQMDNVLEEKNALNGDSIRSKFLKLNHSFHETIYESCGNTHLYKIISQVTALPLALRHYGNFLYEELLHSQKDHHSILRALISGEGERAAALMREHILAARDRMLLDNRDLRGVLDFSAV